MKIVTLYVGMSMLNFWSKMFNVATSFARFATLGQRMFNEIYQVVIAAGSHLFPFRTEKLSPLAPMVLQCNAGE